MNYTDERKTTPEGAAKKLPLHSSSAGHPLITDTESEQWYYFGQMTRHCRWAYRGTKLWQKHTARLGGPVYGEGFEWTAEVSLLYSTAHLTARTKKDLMIEIDKILLGA